MNLKKGTNAIGFWARLNICTGCFYRVDFPHGSSVVLCFGLVPKTVLITHRFLVITEQCLHSLKLFAAVRAAILWVGWGCTRNLEGTLPGQLTPADPSNVSYHTMLRNKSCFIYDNNSSFFKFVFPTNSKLFSRISLCIWMQFHQFACGAYGQFELHLSWTKFMAVKIA